MIRMTRREALATAGAAAVGSSLSAPGASAQTQDKAVKRGRLRQSVCRWCYAKIPLEEFCRGAAAMGLTAVDLLQPEEWEVAAKHGLICSTGFPGQGGGSIPDGLNNRALHDTIVRTFEGVLPKAKQMGVPNLITFFGNRRGMSDSEAADNCIACLTRLAPIAEANGVTIVVELLNSKVDHAHYHTGGVPGRHELDPTQELQWPAIVKAILDTGYMGYFAHEFIPTRDPMTSLREAIVLCDV